MSLNLVYKVNKPIDSVFEYLTVMEKFVSIHPVIDKIEPLSNNNFLVYETLKFGFIPLSFTYQTFLSSNLAEKTVEMKAIVMKFTKIKIFFLLKSEGNSTHVTETIHFKSPFPIKGIMGKIFIKQHNTLFTNMNLEAIST